MSLQLDNMSLSAGVDIVVSVSGSKEEKGPGIGAHVVGTEVIVS